jgi:O-antigen ligase
MLFDRALAAGLEREPVAPAEKQRVGRAAHPAAFAGLFIFTLFLYMRPNDLFHGFFGSFPLVRIIAIATILIYVFAKLNRSERLTIWPAELKMLGVIFLLGLAFTPIAASQEKSVTTLIDTFLKVATIFVLMINLIVTRERLYLMLKLMVICGAVISVGTVKGYVTGEISRDVDAMDNRLTGFVGGLFGNANDFAMAMNLLLPLAVVLALRARGRARLFYLLCAASLLVGVIMSFSRGGFLGLVAMGLTLLWKVGRQNRAATIMLALMSMGLFLVALPNGYTDRLFTILHLEKDETGSAKERRELLDRAITLAGEHIIFGVGMGNYTIYSVKDKRAHNSYLEIWVELGVVGFIAYLILILRPLGSLRAVERETVNSHRARDHDLYLLTVGVQAAIVAYLVCSLFGSVQYDWYIYYPVAYAIAIKQLHLRETGEPGVEGEKAIAATSKKGALWGAS